MKSRRLLSLLLVLLLTFCLLAGCGSNTASSYGGDKESPAEDFNRDESGVIKPTAADSDLYNGSDDVQTISPVNQKLIRTIYLDAETEDMDTLLANIEARVSQLQGYIENREVYNGSSYNSKRYRYANLTIRIPAEHLSDFIKQVGDVSNIISNREEADDITLTYVATQSRITALETEQTRLLELLAKAENMEDLLLIESRLTEVRTELEKVTSQLRLFDNLVNYGTIHLNLNEVRQYTVVEEPESIWERMGTGFMESLQSLGNGLAELFVFLVVSLPYMLVIAAVVTTIVLIIKFNRKKKRQKTPPPQNPQ